MTFKAAEQALKKTEELKAKIQQRKDNLFDTDAWLCLQQLQKTYQQILILDLEYALDLKLEQDLWNLGFKNYIGSLQSYIRDKKNSKRAEAQTMLTWCLEAASGFYITLFQEICSAFNLDLPFRRKSQLYGYISTWKIAKHLKKPNKSSCLYICQYCLVHLGDIARYQNRMKQAELFYHQAVSLSPCSGQPYNQLALLEASRGDKIGSVFYYIRSIAVKNPFPVASINLSKILTSVINNPAINFDKYGKLTSSEYVTIFLKLHGLLLNLQNLESALSYTRHLIDNLTALVATESFSSWKLVQMLVINIYTFHKIDDISLENMGSEDLTLLRETAKSCILDFIAASLSTLLLPVYTIKNSLLSYFALPTVKLCLEWINQEQDILVQKAFKSRLQIWPSLCVLLNGLQKYVTDFKDNEHSDLLLPEDRNLQGFLYLKKYHRNLQFDEMSFEDDVDVVNKVRAVRILHLGQTITNYDLNGFKLMIQSQIDGESVFSSVIKEAEIKNELMEDLVKWDQEKKKLTVENLVPSKSIIKKSSLESNVESRTTEVKSLLQRNHDVNYHPVAKASTSNSPSIRKPRQNIAMQAIMRQAENEQKQVTFRNIDHNKLNNFSTNLGTSINGSVPVNSFQAHQSLDNNAAIKNFTSQNEQFSSQRSLSNAVHQILPGVVMSQASYIPLPGHQSSVQSDYQFMGQTNNFPMQNSNMMSNSHQQQCPPPPIYPPENRLLNFTESNHIPMNSRPLYNDLNTWKNSSPPQQLMSWWGPRNNGHPMPQNPHQKWANPSSIGSHIRNGPSNFSHNFGSNLENFEQKQSNQDTYSLFSDNGWSFRQQVPNSLNEEQMKLRLHQQSLWSGSGPSPLERLLEQQRSLREGGT